MDSIDILKCVVDTRGFTPVALLKMIFSIFSHSIHPRAHARGLLLIIDKMIKLFLKGKSGLDRLILPLPKQIKSWGKANRKMAWWEMGSMTLRPLPKRISEWPSEPGRSGH
jgi:hypothetical protein